jgi:urea carboxylase system permease
MLRASAGITMQTKEADELAKFGYKQQLDRSLGFFSSFAAGFSYISIMTGVFALFFFGFASGGPAFIWTWPTVFAGQMLVALCFAELAGQYPLAGSVYQWSKQIAQSFTSWIAGWMLTVGSIVTLAAVAVAYQIVLPQISSTFQIIGGGSDIGQVATPNGAKNALLLAAGLIVFTTVINMIGVKTMARINNFGVVTESVGVLLLIVLLAVHTTRGPSIVFDTFGVGQDYTFGYFGAFLVAGLMSAYVLYGFDTAGSLAEETHDPRRHAPPAIIWALTAAGVGGLLIILFAEVSVPNIHSPQIATSGLPFVVKATLGNTIGNVFLIDSAIAITVCGLAVHAGAVRMIFTMGRDGRLPFAPAIAQVHSRSRTPLVASIATGVLAIALLVLNMENQRAFFVLTSVAIITFYVAYLCVTGPLLIARTRGKWRTASDGKYFSLGRWGWPVNLLAVIFQMVVIVNLGWPRAAVYGSDHWYYQWGALVFITLLGSLGAIYYLVAHRGHPVAVVLEHRSSDRKSQMSPDDPIPISK